MEPESRESLLQLGKPSDPPAPEEQTLLLLKRRPTVRKEAHGGEKRCHGVPVGTPQLLEGDWFSSFLLHDPLHRVRGRMGCEVAGWDGETQVLFPVLLLIFSRLEQDPESAPVSAGGDRVGLSNLLAVVSRGAAQSTLLSLTNCNPVPGYSPVSS